MTVPEVDAALQVRASAARQLIRSKELTPAVALSYVVWPSPEVEEASASGRRRLLEERRARAVELVDAGLSRAAAAREVGCAKASVGEWVRAVRRSASAECSASPSA